jgi:hypothetical protein
MRYQPVMPYWSHQNEWYKSAFAAMAPSKAPAAIAPCGSATMLTSGGNSSVDAMVMRAGRRLNDANPLNAYQGEALVDYLEAPKSSAGMGSTLSAPGTAVTSAANN